MQLPVGTPEAPPILDVCAQFLFLVLQPRLRYPLKEAAILLAISERQLRYRVDNGEIHPVWEGDKLLFTFQELKRYAFRDHDSIPHASKKRVKK